MPKKKKRSKKRQTREKCRQKAYSGWVPQVSDRFGKVFAGVLGLWRLAKANFGKKRVR